jgi:hypothetical protein
VRNHDKDSQIEVVAKAIDGLNPSQLTEEQKALIEEAMINFLIRNEMSEAWAIHDVTAEDVKNEKNLWIENLVDNVRDMLGLKVHHSIHCEADGVPVFGYKKNYKVAL